MKINISVKNRNSIWVKQNIGVINTEDPNFKIFQFMIGKNVVKMEKMEVSR